MPQKDTYVGGTHPERFNKRGELIITRRQLVMLHALLDTPDGTAKTLAEWYRLTYPYGKEYVAETARRMPRKWVLLFRYAHGLVGARLEQRGRDIVAGAVPAYVHGRGPFQGMRALLAPHRH